MRKSRHTFIRGLSVACVVATAIAVACSGARDVGSCQTPTAPGCSVQTQQQPTFPPPASQAPPLATYSATGVVTKGTATQIAIAYANGAMSPARQRASTNAQAMGGDTIPATPVQLYGQQYLTLTFGADALDQRPDGTQITAGQSMTVTATVDPQTMQVTLEPSGLTFNPNLVTLTISYGGLDVPSGKEADVTIYTRRDPTQSWTALSGATHTTLGTLPAVSGTLAHFTQYAIAY